MVGLIGSLLGRWIGALVNIAPTLTEFSLGGLLVSFAGAVLLLGIVNLIQRGRLR